MAEVPGVPEAVFVGVSRNLTVGIIKELAELKAEGVVIYASGFGESDDGKALQTDLLSVGENMDTNNFYIHDGRPH